jgi:hypothetical protein
MRLRPELVVLDVGVPVLEVVAACLVEALAVVATFTVAKMSVLVHRVIVVCCATLEVVVPGAATWPGLAISAMSRTGVASFTSIELGVAT